MTTHLEHAMNMERAAKEETVKLFKRACDLTVENARLQMELYKAERLANHYAALLASSGGVPRKRFPRAKAWIGRLRSLATGSAAP